MEQEPLLAQNKIVAFEEKKWRGNNVESEQSGWELYEKDNMQGGKYMVNSYRDVAQKINVGQ